MRAEIDAGLQRLIGWGQHSKEEPERAGGSHGATSQPPSVLLQVFALLPSCQAPARFSRSPGQQLIPWQGAEGEKGDRLFPTLYPAWSCFCVSLELLVWGHQVLHTRPGATLGLQH